MIITSPLLGIVVTLVLEAFIGANPQRLFVAVWEQYKGTANTSFSSNYVATFNKIKVQPTHRRIFAHKNIVIT